MHRRPILIDLDETVYPFLHTWDAWLQRQGKSVDWDAFVWFYDIDSYLHDHIELQPHFLAEQHVLDPQPIPEAVAALTLLHSEFPIIACTARNGADWHEATTEWLHRHLPFVNDVVFTRTERGDSAVRKAQVAERLNALALIDDTSEWLKDLPAETEGYLVKRPQPLASDAGALDWHEIADAIMRRK